MPLQEEDFIYLKTSEAAKAIGVPEHELHYWEKLGILSPMRINSGHRRYRKSDIRRGQLIKKLFEEGYNSKGVKILLSKKRIADNTIKIPDSSFPVKQQAILAELKKEIQEVLKMVKKLQR